MFLLLAFLAQIVSADASALMCPDRVYAGSVFLRSDRPDAPNPLCVYCPVYTVGEPNYGVLCGMNLSVKNPPAEVFTVPLCPGRFHDPLNDSEYCIGHCALDGSCKLQ